MGYAPKKEKRLLPLPMPENPSNRYSDMGKKLDDYQKIEELVGGLALSLGLGGTKEDWEGRVSDRLKSVLSKTLTERTLDRIGSDLLKMEGE